MSQLGNTEALFTVVSFGYVQRLHGLSSDEQARLTMFLDPYVPLCSYIPHVPDEGAF